MGILTNWNKFKEIAKINEVKYNNAKLYTDKITKDVKFIKKKNKEIIENGEKSWGVI